MPQLKTHMTTRQAAEELGVSHARVKRMLMEGDLTKVVVNPRLNLVLTSEVNDMKKRAVMRPVYLSRKRRK